MVLVIVFDIISSCNCLVQTQCYYVIDSCSAIIIQVQLSVTPILEGILKILGVRWKLSGLVGGYQFFEFATKRKQRRGKKGNTHSLSNDLNFIVIKVLLSSGSSLFCY